MCIESGAGNARQKGSDADPGNKRAVCSRPNPPGQNQNIARIYQRAATVTRRNIGHTSLGKRGYGEPLGNFPARLSRTCCPRFSVRLRLKRAWRVFVAQVAVPRVCRPK